MCSSDLVMDAVVSGPAGGNSYEGPLAAERQILANAKKLTLFAAGAAAQKYPTQLPEQQEIMADLADMTMQVFALESALLRARKKSRSAADKPLKARLTQSTTFVSK